MKKVLLTVVALVGLSSLAFGQRVVLKGVDFQSGRQEQIAVKHYSPQNWSQPGVFQRENIMVQGRQGNWNNCSNSWSDRWHTRLILETVGGARERLNIRNMQIKYCNGQMQMVQNMNGTFAGNQRRVIALQGQKRRIQSIMYNYRVMPVNGPVGNDVLIARKRIMAVANFYQDSMMAQGQNRVRNLYALVRQTPRAALRNIQVTFCNGQRRMVAQRVVLQQGQRAPIATFQNARCIRQISFAYRTRQVGVLAFRGNAGYNPNPQPPVNNDVLIGRSRLMAVANFYHGSIVANSNNRVRSLYGIFRSSPRIALRNVQVTFCNGQSRMVAQRLVLQQGQRTPIASFQNARCIQSVRFSYKTQQVGILALRGRM